MVKGDLLGLASAVTAAAVPRVDDLSPETVLGGPLRDQLRSFNPVRQRA